MGQDAPISPDAEVDPDREVLARVAAGDTAAFAELVERHEKRLMGLCHRMLGDTEAARDATQETLLKVFRKAASFKPRGKVSTWIHRIAVNQCLNQLRHRRIVRFLSFGELGKPTQEDDDGPAFDPPDNAPDAADRLASQRRWQRTRRVIDRLPPGQRAVLVLAKFEGFSYRQVAETLGITESAVESRLFRAMRRVTQALEKAQDLPE